MNVKVDKKNYAICNIYAHNNDKPEFFQQVLDLINNYDENRIICTDFNLVMDPEKDYKGNHSYKNNDKSVETIKNYMDAMLLSDIWQVRNPETLQLYGEEGIHYQFIQD